MELPSPVARSIRLRFALVLVGLAGFFAESAFADDWPGAFAREVFSPSRNFKLRVVPGTNQRDVAGFANPPEGPNATAELSRRTRPDVYTPVRTFTLLNPVAPVDLYLTDSGLLITFDNWANMGHGKVVALYGPDGSALRSYSLQDLFSAEDLKRFVPSVSSLWWRQPLGGVTFLAVTRGDGPKLKSGQRSICIATEIKGRHVEFDLETGAFALRGERECVPFR